MFRNVSLHFSKKKRFYVGEQVFRESQISSFFPLFFGDLIVCSLRHVLMETLSTFISVKTLLSVASLKKKKNFSHSFIFSALVAILWDIFSLSCPSRLTFHKSHKSPMINDTNWFFLACFFSCFRKTLIFACNDFSINWKRERSTETFFIVHKSIEIFQVFLSFSLSLSNSIVM